MTNHRLTDAEILQLEQDLHLEQDQSPLIFKGMVATICGTIALVIATTGVIVFLARWL